MGVIFELLVQREVFRRFRRPLKSFSGTRLESLGGGSMTVDARGEPAEDSR
jgi:hypothetical protein